MSITQQEAEQIRTEHALIKQNMEIYVQVSENTTKQVGELVEKVGELVSELKQRDVRDEYREKEYLELKEAIHTTNEKIDEYIKSKSQIVEWAERRKEFYDALWAGITSTWGKLTGALIIVALASALGLDLPGILK